MNRTDDQLQRLFRAAAQVKSEAEPVPFGLETRVLAAWRTASPFSFWDTGLLVRGLMVAVLIMGISLWPSLRGANTASTNPFSVSLQLADTDTTVQFDSSP